VRAGERRGRRRERGGRHEGERAGGQGERRERSGRQGGGEEAEEAEGCERGKRGGCYKVDKARSQERDAGVSCHLAREREAPLHPLLSPWYKFKYR
jgi:hypothetical protein